MAVLLDILIVAGLGWFLVTQVLLPAIWGQPWFPLFKRKRRQLEDELRQVNEQQALRQLERELKQRREQLRNNGEDKKNGNRNERDGDDGLE